MFQKLGADSLLSEFSAAGFARDKVMRVQGYVARGSPNCESPKSEDRSRKRSSD